MGTRIVFAAAAGSEALALSVREDPDDVLRQFRNTGGSPFQVTPARGPGPVHVNPGMIAYWELEEPDA